MITQSTQSDAVEYAALPAPAAGWDELVLWGILLGALLVFWTLVVRAVLRWWAARSPHRNPVDLSFLSEWIADIGDTVDRTDAERVRSWLERAELESCAASAAARVELLALLQIPRYGGPAVDAAPIRALVEAWHTVLREMEESV